MLVIYLYGTETGLHTPKGRGTSNGSGGELLLITDAKALSQGDAYINTGRQAGRQAGTGRQAGKHRQAGRREGEFGRTNI